MERKINYPGAKGNVKIDISFPDDEMLGQNMRDAIEIMNTISKSITNDLANM